MNRISILEQTYLDQKRSTIKQQNVKKNKCWKGKYRFCLIWTLIGTMVGSIPLTVIVTMYIKQQNYTTTISPSTALLRWNTTGITIAGNSGVSGNTSNQLYFPFGITLDYSNTLYVGDSRNNRVQKYLKGSSIGITVAGQANTSRGSSSNTLQSPSHVLVDSNGNLYISDTGNYRIQFWSNGATSGTTVAGNATGVGGSTNNLLSSPIGIARDLNTGTLYIVDSNNHRVMSYASGASSGNLAAGGNGQGLSQTQLSFPYGLHFDASSNSLIITNRQANNIVRWELGANNWTLVAGNNNGMRGNTSTSLYNPTDVTLDPMGNMYVADYTNHRVQFFYAGQSNGVIIAGVTGISGNNATLLNGPSSIELDSQLNLYVADYINHRIQKFVRY